MSKQHYTQAQRAVGRMVELQRMRGFDMPLVSVDANGLLVSAAYFDDATAILWALCYRKGFRLATALGETGVYVAIWARKFRHPKPGTFDDDLRVRADQLQAEGNPIGIWIAEWMDGHTGWARDALWHLEMQNRADEHAMSRRLRTEHERLVGVQKTIVRMTRSEDTYP